MRSIKLSIVAVACATTPAMALAQGALSTQGFGYPPGQMSARALATGGGLTEFDADTPINPASIALTGEPRLFLQYEPEFRKLTNGSLSSNTTTSRFPVIGVQVPAGAHTTVGLSVSTFLDRSSSTKISRTLNVAGDTVTANEANRVEGAINDIRLAIGWTPNPKIQIGLGGHVFTGQNRDLFSQTFADSLKFSNVSQIETLAFTGYGVSAGVVLRPSKVLGIGISGMKGARMSTHAGDTVVSEANVPDRYSAGISYEGIPGSSISAHISHDQWSSLNGLGTAGAAATDGWDAGGGVEAIGPQIAARQTILRLGARYRTLPFVASGGKVKELSFAGGVGAQFFRNRASFDVTLERSMRTADASALDGVQERAYILSFGLRVRP
jgi:hypothetical protein